VLAKVGEKVSTIDGSFTAHPKIAKLFDSRLEMMKGSGQIDWGLGEMLAYGSLLSEGHSVRLSGQDCRRGTFSHRHAVLTDFNTNEKYHALRAVAEKGAIADVINSPLSEVGVMGFEFGYSVARRNDLVLWEAQFGD
jgi:2-oxoglutarate dehydrogenase E1 component